MSVRKAALGLTSASIMLVAGVAQAQVARVFVSVNGNDANVCSNIATPCRTLGAGITQVDPEGEVIVIDSGSYAGATVTKPVKVNAAPGVVAFSGLTITVDPGAGGVVVLRGLTLKAATPGSGTGIFHQSGTLLLEDAVVDGWFRGLISTGSTEGLLIKGSVFRNHAFGGLLVQVGNTAPVAIDGSFFEKNGVVGVELAGGTGHVSSTVMTANTTGGSVNAAAVDVTFQRCEITNNTTGLRVFNGGVLRVSHSTIARNGTGLSNTSSTLQSFGNNVLEGNTTASTGTISAGTLQ